MHVVHYALALVNYKRKKSMKLHGFGYEEDLGRGGKWKEHDKIFYMKKLIKIKIKK